MTFNPTLVRLRPRGSKAGSSLPRAFNPTLVRLRRPSADVSLPAASGFQSHAGSIEACQYLLGMQPALFTFNPTLVRLRPRWPRCSGAPSDALSIPRWFD